MDFYRICDETKNINLECFIYNPDWNYLFSTYKSVFAPYGSNKYIGNSILSIIDARIQHPGYDGYFVMEYDCAYTGSYESLFSILIANIESNKYDVIQEFEPFNLDKNMYWLKYGDTIDSDKINLDMAKQCLYQFCYFSDNALKQIQDEYDTDAYNCHYEIALTYVINKLKLNVGYLDRFIKTDLSWENKDHIYPLPKNVLIHPIKNNICDMKIYAIIMVKNEHRYLKEWVDYHLNIGFTDIFVYEDFGSDSHKDIIGDNPHVHIFHLDDGNVLSLEYKNQRNRQPVLYNQLLDQFRYEADWICFIDTDEFVTFEDGYDMNQLTEDFKDKDGVYMFWNFYGGNGHVLYDDVPVRKRFTKPAEIHQRDLSMSLKSFIHIAHNRDLKFKNHHFVEGLCSPTKIKAVCRIIGKRIWLNHYFTKSWEEWCWRFIQRGDVINNNRGFEEYFDYNPEMRPQKNQLMALCNQWKENYKNTGKMR